MRIFGADQGGDTFQTGGIQAYCEDLKRVSNADMGPKDYFERILKHFDESLAPRLKLTLRSGLLLQLHQKCGDACGVQHVFQIGVVEGMRIAEFQIKEDHPRSM
jgi:hypothetical protein